MDSIGAPINMKDWIEESRNLFAPPVCNKLMYGAGQLKIMFVGGPNTRKDYHIDEGEEFFYMVKGDMCLKIMEKGEPKDIHIKEGEVFVLPSRIPHSPQRFENTVGLVIERERLREEMDGLRYYCDDNKTILFEKWFHCNDLVKALPPVIKEYFASEQYKTGKPIPGTISENPPVKVDTETEVNAPIKLKQWLENNNTDIKSAGSKQLFGKGEFKSAISRLVLLLGQQPEDAEMNRICYVVIDVLADGEQETKNDGETWLWQLEGSSEITVNGDKRCLREEDVILIPANSRFTMKRSDGSICISVIMDPYAAKQT